MEMFCNIINVNWFNASLLNIMINFFLMSLCPIPVELTFVFYSFLRVSFNYPVWSYGPVDPEELMRIKRRQVQPQQPRQSNTFRILQEGLERECFISLHFLHSNLLNKAQGCPM